MINSRKQLFFIFSVAMGAICLYGAVRFFTADEPARIRHTIYTAVLGIEKKDRARYGAILSPQYQDAQGNNKFTLLKVVEDTLRDFVPVKCDIQQLTVEMKEKDTAEVTIGFKFYFKNMQDMKLYYDAGKILAHFVKEGRSWRIEQLDYTSMRDITLFQGVS